MRSFKRMLRYHRRVAALRQFRYSSLSTASSWLLSTAHESLVHFKASDAASTDVRIRPVIGANDLKLRVVDQSNEMERFFSIVSDAEKLCIEKISDEKVTLELVLPYRVNLHVSVANGSVSMVDKIEGDVNVVVGHGDIAVQKVRGSTVKLKTNGGKIDISELVEGENVRLEARDGVKCQKLLAAAAEVKLGKGEWDSEFGAVYASTCTIVSSHPSHLSTLRVGNVHGYLRVAGEGLKRVQVDSVTGDLTVEDSGDKCDVTAHFDSWTPDSASSILVGGNVRVSLHPAAPIHTELHGARITIGQDCEFRSSEMDQLDEDYAIFTGELQPQEIVAASLSSGKINVDSAKDDAMRTSFFMKPTSSDRYDEREESKTPRLFVHSLCGEVSLEQLNWMDNIKRKHLKR
ncbi:hypothetical protein PsorP6_015807 [Peronosclerospora sorghi]|uniref:Uncharacterized protein n=1 Tax=Peronosclerospora sorghi TaxID=230839 RepID=A0ACC0WQY6_9STRA|nr:hypothetical protein PsorP6_015807 [Peronosclerospora sorghi]